MALTLTNEKMVNQIGQMGALESETMELRRLLRAMRNNTSGINHLWSIKEAEYENLHEILQELQY